MPAAALHLLPDHLSATAGALVEPAGNALRAVDAAQIRPGDEVCVWGPGTLGLLALQFATTHGAAVDVVGLDAERLELATQLGARSVLLAADAANGPMDRYACVIDTSNSPDVANLAVHQVEPSGRVVLIGLADTPSTIDTRDVVFRDITMVGILAASAGLDGAIELLASGVIQTDPLVAATVRLDDVADVLAGRRPRGAGPGPKIHVDPRL